MEEYYFHIECAVLNGSLTIDEQISLLDKGYIIKSHKVDRCAGIIPETDLSNIHEIYIGVKKKNGEGRRFNISAVLRLS